MPKSTTFAEDIIALIFNGTNISLIADNTATTPLTVLYLSLHNGNPGIGGNQTTNETAYTNYTRVSVARNSGGWTCSGGVATLAVLTQFPQCGASGDTLTYVAIGTASSGSGLVLYAGALNASLTVANLIQPQFASSSLTTTES